MSKSLAASASIEELDHFSRFARDRISGDVGDVSLEDCLRQWRAAQEQTDVVDSVARGAADMEAGRCASLADAESRVRQKLALRVTGK